MESMLMWAVPTFPELFPAGVSLAHTSDQGEARLSHRVTQIRTLLSARALSECLTAQCGKLRPHTTGFYPTLLAAASLSLWLAQLCLLSHGMLRLRKAQF